MDKLPRPLLGMFVFFLVTGLFDGPEAVAQGLKKGDRLADYFGFLPLEIYKLEHRISNLLLRDLDGDKVDDIVVINNGRSRIDLLLSTKKPDDDQSNRPFRKDVNEVQTTAGCGWSASRSTRRSSASRPATSTATASPTWPSTARPAEVEILFNEGQGRFGNPKKINTGEARRAGQRADRRRPRPRRPGRPRPARPRRAGVRLPGREGEARRARAAAAHGRATPGWSGPSTSTATAATTW